MLYTRNAFLFRKFFKEEIARETNWLDLNFIGSLHPDKKRTETGFAKLIYGNREDLGKLLGTIALNVAADDQAIYELIQNADDCKSSFFSVSYNEKYLLCINNGNYFSDNDMSAIINVAGNFKEGEDIGTFGIGFKILHRLVGTDDGRDAIINNYAGPIIFSWNKFFQLQKFLNGEEVRTGYDAEKDKENAWLIKILYTCFPSHFGEKVRLKDYETQETKFEETELNEMREFLKNSLQNVNLQETNNLKNGSIFFLKLGEGKSKFLDGGIDKIKSGLSYSSKFLNSLKKIYINGEEIQEQKVDFYGKSYSIDSAEFLKINPKNKKRDIKFTFAFYKDYRKAENLRNGLVPNLYTFFSMDEEKNGFNFLLHCNAFDMNNDRRKLQANSQINENLLPTIANEITQYIEKQKDKNRDLFLSLYANLLLSNEPKSKQHINNYLFKFLKDYLYQNIPTQNGYSTTPENVKIKATFLPIQPSDFGCPEIEWFAWQNEKTDKTLIDEARKPEKLHLEKWDIVDLLKYAISKGKIAIINEWVKQANEKHFADANNKDYTYLSFVQEIDKNILERDLPIISQIKLFKFSDGNYYSLNEVFANPNLVLIYDKVAKIKQELRFLGLVVSNLDISKNPNLLKMILPKINEEILFKAIAEKSKDNNLRAEQKHNLFFTIAEFERVGAEKLKNLELFKDTQGNIRPLRTLLKGDLQVPNWLFGFKVHKAEYIPELDKFLVKENEIYQEIILPNWDDIISKVTNITEFYTKVKFYYDQDEKNTPLKKQAFVFLSEDEGFVPASDVFYNAKFLQVGNYQNFQNAIYSLIDAQTPKKEVLKYLKEAPFKVENTNLFDYSINDNVELDLQELKAVIEFCKKNNESFFENCVIEKQEQSFIVSEKSSNVYQIRPPKKEVKQFIEENLDDTFKILPYELDEFKDEVGIIQGEKLYDIIVSEINVDDFKEELVNILAYDEPKRKFVLQLSEIRLVSGEQYTKDSFEFKTLNLACDVLKNKEDVVKFKDKVIVETDEQDLTLSEIPPFADKVKIESCELSLAKILPNTYQNSDHLSNLIQHFVSVGMDKNRLNSLFGINQEPEISDIFKLFSEETTTLENAEQLAFLILYNEYIENIDLSSFKVETLGDEYNLHEYSYYTKKYPFLIAGATLNEKYKGIEKIFQNFPVVINSKKETFLLKEPFFSDEKFICPDIDTEMSDEQKLSFIEFLFNQWDKKNKKMAIRNIDWTTINETETEKLLDFDPNYCVYPSKYALESEELPKYLEEWLGEDNIKTNFIADLGVFTEGSTLLALRKYFCNEVIFNKSKIAQDSRLADGKMLFNTFEWLKSKEIELNSKEKFEVLEEMVRVINSNRTQGQELLIQNEYDFELLESEAIEWQTPYYEHWKEKLEDKFSIYLFEGALPKIIKLDEIADYVFYRFNQHDIVIDETNRIFVNRNADIKKALSSLIADDENEFSTEDLLLLYQTQETIQTENDEVAELLSENERLRKRIAELEGVSGTAFYSATVSFDNDYHNEIKEKSEQYLFKLLKKNYPSQTVKWLNYNEDTDQFEESWKNHDFEILNKNGSILHYIDCKGTPQQKRTFYLTSNEWEFFLDCVQNGKSYQIYRIFNVEGNPNSVHIDNLWEWIKTGKVVPYLSATETIKGGRVFLTLT